MTRLLNQRAILSVFALTVVLFVASGFIERGLLSAASVRTIVLLTSFVIIVSFGQGLVILSGGLDLSVGAIITLGGVLLGAWVPQSNEGLWWAIPDDLGDRVYFRRLQRFRRHGASHSGLRYDVGDRDYRAECRSRIYARRATGDTGSRDDFGPHERQLVRRSPNHLCRGRTDCGRGSSSRT